MSNWFMRIIRPPQKGFAQTDEQKKKDEKKKQEDAENDAADALGLVVGKKSAPNFDVFIDEDGNAFSVIDGKLQTPSLGKTRPPGTTSSSSTSKSYQDPVYLEILAQQGRDAAEQFWAKIKADTKAADAQQRFLTSERLGGQTFTTNERLGGQTFTTGERLGRQEFDSGENQLGRQFTSSENQLGRQFQGAESMLGRQFTSGESAIDRAQRAGEFAANYSIAKAQALRQDREAALNAARLYTELTASPDLTGFQRFLSAGGGSVGNALQRGATSMTREGQLGAARALQVSEQPPTTYKDYNFTPQTNPYAGMMNQFAGATNQYANAVNPVLVVQRPAVSTPIIPPAFIPPASVAPFIDGGSWNPGTSGQSYLDRPGIPPDLLKFLRGGESTSAPDKAQVAAPSDRIRFDYGDGEPYGQVYSPAPPQMAVSSPFDYGDGEPLGQVYSPAPMQMAVPSPSDYGDAIPMPAYANGIQQMPVGMNTQFIAGDDANLNNPFAFGADPETVSINDPTGDATFSVDPLEQPGAPEGPSNDDRLMKLSTLLKALGQFLDSGNATAPMPVMPQYAFGTSMMPRYSYGTGIIESDNPYIDRVMAQRQATPYTINTQAADYSFGSPTMRSINEMGAQVATGVPMAEFGWEANRLRPGMLSRDSLNLGQ